LHLQKFVHRVIKKYLDETICRSMQSHNAVENVKETVLSHYSELKDFQNAWLVFDLIQLRLKYTSSKGRYKERIGVETPKELKG
ncbi:hypothetical protein J3R82DRAFT_4619, partial [Butyriboletus roseoflavus]